MGCADTWSEDPALPWSSSRKFFICEQHVFYRGALRFQKSLSFRLLLLSLELLLKHSNCFALAISLLRQLLVTSHHFRQGAWTRCTLEAKQLTIFRYHRKRSVLCFSISAFSISVSVFVSIRVCRCFCLCLSLSVSLSIVYLSSRCCWRSETFSGCAALARLTRRHRPTSVTLPSMLSTEHLQSPLSPRCPRT